MQHMGWSKTIQDIYSLVPNLCCCVVTSWKLRWWVTACSHPQSTRRSIRRLHGNHRIASWWSQRGQVAIDQSSGCELMSGTWLNILKLKLDMVHIYVYIYYIYMYCVYMLNEIEWWVIISLQKGDKKVKATRPAPYSGRGKYGEPYCGNFSCQWSGIAWNFFPFRSSSNANLQLYNTLAQECIYLGKL